MIVAGPNSSHLLGSLETTVHTSGFKCFVHTFRPLFMFGQWKTEIVECHSATGISVRKFARFKHSHGVGLEKVHAVHDSFCQESDESGRNGSDLSCAVSAAYHSLWGQKGMDGWRESTMQERARFPQASSMGASIRRHSCQDA